MATAIELALLSVLLPLIMYVIHRIRTRPIRFSLYFYLFQVFHKITQMFLDMASIKDIESILVAEKKKNPKIQIFCSYFYGNLENKLFVLSKVFADDQHFHKSLSQKSQSDFYQYLATCNECLDEIDHLTTLSIFLPRIHEELFAMRMLIFQLRDMVGEVIEKYRNCVDVEDFNFFDMERVFPIITECMKQFFMKRKKLIDSVDRNKARIILFRMLISLPGILCRRLLNRFSRA